MLYLISLLPIAVYLLIIKAMDGFSLASWQKLGLYCLWGIATCFISLGLSKFIKSDSAWVFPFIEELLKGLPLVIALLRRKSAFFAESLIYGTAIGAGFALIENTLYVCFNPDFLMGDAIIRGFSTALLHMGCTSILATTALVASRLASGKPKPFLYLLTLLSLLPSFALHYVYNLFLLPEYVQMLLTVVIMFVFFIGTYEIDGRLIHNWLDMCVTNDIQLLKAIREGHLTQSAAGEYLMQIKDKFKPLVFFDICCYLGLYLELTIAAKSRMILNEAGMDIPIPEEEHEKNMQKIQELEALKKNIGPTGLMVLNPIISQKATDQVAIRTML